VLIIFAVHYGLLLVRLQEFFSFDYRGSVPALSRRNPL